MLSVCFLASNPIVLAPHGMDLCCFKHKCQPKMLENMHLNVKTNTDASTTSSCALAEQLNKLMWILNPSLTANAKAG